MKQRILIIPLVLAVCLLSVRWAFGASEVDGWFGVPTTLTNVILIITFVSLIVTQVYGLWNRQNHATRDATIKDLNALLAARDATIAERERTLKETMEKHKAQLDALTAKTDLEIKGLQDEIKGLRVNNRAVTNVNLIAIAELAALREAGVWEGDEQEIFRRAGLTEITHDDKH